MASRPVGEAGFLHSYAAQCGFPRARGAIERLPDGSLSRDFAARHGGLIVSVSAGMIGERKLDLPCGPIPRMMMLDICDRAVRRKSAEVPLEPSARQYSERLGVGHGGGRSGGYTRFRGQVQATVASSVRYLWEAAGRRVQYQGMPVAAFDAWSTDGDGQLGLWPGELVLSADFYASLREHALPLEWAAYRSLSWSALAMDWYAWLAYYLPRLRKPTVWSWHDLHDVLGHGQSFSAWHRASVGIARRRAALWEAVRAYPPAAAMGSVQALEAGTGLILRPAAPAIRRAWPKKGKPQGK